MSFPKKFPFTQEQRQEIECLLGRGTTESRLHARAEIIRRLMDGQSAYRVAADMHLTYGTTSSGSTGAPPVRLSG